MPFARKGFLGKNLVIGQKVPRFKGVLALSFILQTKRQSHPEKQGLNRDPPRPSLEHGGLAQTLSSDHVASLVGVQRAKGGVCFLHSECSEGTWQSQHKHRKQHKSDSKLTNCGGETRKGCRAAGAQQEGVTQTQL